MAHIHQQLFDTLADYGLPLTDEYKAKITARINDVLTYEPLVGVFGKTGAGKSSLCNAVFGQDVCPISDVAACTRSAQEVKLGIGHKGMKLLDVPGVGESSERDDEYDRLYQQWLPKLDLVLWVIKADDRALASDEGFYKRLVRPYMEAGKPFFIVLNQVDKVEPFREWDEQARQPGARQAANIAEKRRSVAGFFGLPLDQVIAVSAGERYGLVELVDRVIHALPRDKRVAVLREVVEDYRSEQARQETSRGFLEMVLETVMEVAPILSAVAKPLMSLGSKLVSAVGSFFSRWF